MNVKQAYAQWAEQYDTNLNKTRDLEAISLRKTLEPITATNCLEIGCGTGKNTQWLAGKTQHLTAVDLTEEMLEKAKEKAEKRYKSISENFNYLAQNNHNNNGENLSHS